MNLKGKIVWITGASSGIGKALAIALSKKKARLILSGRNSDSLEKVAQICSKDTTVAVLPLDLEKTSSLSKKGKEAIALFNGLDLLINNAGISQRALAMETDLEVDRRLIEVNYFGTIALTKSILPYFQQQQQGMVVCITSIVGKIGTPYRSSYAASKHALHGYFDSLRAEVHQDHIKICLLCPGFVHTQITKNALTGNGSPLNLVDPATKNGLSPEKFAQIAIKKISREKEEAAISGWKEKMAVLLKRFFPSLFSIIIRKVAVR